MRSPELRLGALPPLRVSPATLLTIALVAVLVYPALSGGEGGPLPAVLLALGIGVFLMLSVLGHEVAHAVAARAFGAQVDHIALTLWGGHTQYLGENVRPGQSVVISLAGPLVNLALGAGLALVDPWVHSPAAAAFVFFGSSMNYALAVFNLLPGLPMDGGRAVEGLIGALLHRPRLGTVVTAWIGRVIAVAVLVLPLIRLRLSDGRGGFDLVVLVWAVLIALTLWQGAGSALESARMEGRVEELRVEDFARPVHLLPADLTLDALPTDGAACLVLQGGSAFGVSPSALAEVPRSRLTTTPVSAVLQPLGSIGRLRPGLRGHALVTAMLASQHPQYLVGEAGAESGVVRTADVNAHLRGVRSA